MGCLSNTQIKHRNAGRKGGRGKKGISLSPTKTPQRPKTTVWRYRSKAAAAEQELHLAALANIRALKSSRPSTAGSVIMTIGSTGPSTGYISLLQLLEVQPVLLYCHLIVILPLEIGFTTVVTMEALIPLVFNCYWRMNR